MASQIRFAEFSTCRKLYRHRGARSSCRSFAPSLSQILAAASLAVVVILTGQSPQAAMQRPFQWGYIDKTGRIVIEPASALAGDFHDGIARVAPQWGANWGYIDKANKTVVPPILEDAEDFHEGLAQVAIRRDFGGNLWGFIDKSGTMVIAARFAYSRPFSEGLASVDGGFVDRNGALVIAQQFLDTGDFTEGLAPVADFIPPGMQ